jgi:hypothetical protein
VRVEIPVPPLMLPELSVTVRPREGLAVSSTMPVNPLIDAAEIVTVAVEPAFNVTVVGLAVIVKSVKVKAGVTVWASIPSVAVIVTGWLLAIVEVQLSVAVPEPETVLGVIALQVRPDGTESPSATVPANPLTAVSVIVEVVEDPTVVDAGEIATIVKSTNMNVAVDV